jgi:hypothetical protein
VIVGNLARQFSPDEMIVAGEQPADQPATAWDDRWARLVYIGRSLPKGTRGRVTHRRLQIPLLTSRIIGLTRKHDASAVLAVFPSEEYLTAAYLAARLARRRLFGYFHNTYVESRSGGTRLAWAKRVQDAVFGYAEHVFVMSAGMLELYREQYPNLSSSALTHSFNGEIPPFAPPPAPGANIRVALLGNIGEHCLDATRRVCEAVRKMPNVEFRLISGTARSIIEKYDLIDDPDQHRTVPYEQVQGELQWADIVALPHGFSGGYTAEEYRTIFPTRTIDYLLCRRPILAHTPPGSFLTRFLAETRCAQIVERDDVGEVVSGIQALANSSELRNDLVRQALRTAEQFRAPLVAGQLRERLQ